jgi:hypothetical protein
MDDDIIIVNKMIYSSFLNYFFQFLFKKSFIIIFKLFEVF